MGETDKHRDAHERSEIASRADSSNDTAARAHGQDDVVPWRNIRLPEKRNLRE